MGLWARLFGPKQAVPAPADENILVISDIHLGEDVVTTGPEHLDGYIRALNRELAQFVGAHAQMAVDGRKWHLVINGDMFDFVKVSLRPTAEEAYQHWSRHLSDKERAQLPNTPENVVWKLGRILEIHRPLFKELARFLVVGNRITILEGNHDAEFYFPEVQQTLRDFLVKEGGKLKPAVTQGRFSKGRKKDAAGPDDLGERICFGSWFLAGGGRFHIEHGNQYDPYCSFEYNLVPLDRHEAQIVATPMSHRMMPYFSELLGDFSTHGIDTWGFMAWMRYAFNLGPRMLAVLAKVFTVAMWEQLGQTGRRRKEELAALADEHERRLRELSNSGPYGVATLKRLDALKALPAEYSTFRMLRLFYMDRFVLALCALLAVATGLVLATPFGWWLAGLAVVGSLATALALTRLRDSKVEETLREAAARIADLTGARYVVFGHSHHPELVNLRESFGAGRTGENAFYLNSGSWVTREILLGHEGKGMTYVEISSRGGALKRWLGDGHAPVVLASTATSPEPEGYSGMPGEEPA